MHKLLIKTHKKTRLKYLCYTRKKNHNEYLGSGTRWRYHLKKYGKEIETELIFESEDLEQFKQIAIQKSLEYNVVNDDNWANIRIEQGDGGDTVSKKYWINDGVREKYINKNDTIPEGWQKGRSKNCVFKNSERQSQFAKQANPENKAKSLKKCWEEGRFIRDHSKCGTKGDDHIAKRPEVREKIKIAALKDSKNRSERMKKNKPWEYTARNVNYNSKKGK